MYNIILRDSEGGEARFPVAGELIVGREETCDIVLGDPSVSRRHARIWIDGLNLYLEDMGSTNGCYIGGFKIDGKHELKSGDLVACGIYKLRVVSDDPLDGYVNETFVGSAKKGKVELDQPMPKVSVNKSKTPTTILTKEQKEKSLWWLYLLILGGGVVFIVSLFYFCQQ